MQDYDWDDQTALPYHLNHWMPSFFTDKVGRAALRLPDWITREKRKMTDMKKFDVRYWFIGLIVVAVVILVAAMTARNTPVLIMAIGLLATGFGSWINHSPMTYLYPKGSRYTVIEYLPTIAGWIVTACGILIMLYGGYRLISAAT